MRNNKWKKIQYRRKSAPIRKRLVREGAKDEGDFLYDVLSTSNEDGGEYIDVG